MKNCRCIFPCAETKFTGMLGTCESLYFWLRSNEIDCSCNGHLSAGNVKNPKFYYNHTKQQIYEMQIAGNNTEQSTSKKIEWTEPLIASQKWARSKSNIVKTEQPVTVHPNRIYARLCGDRFKQTEKSLIVHNLFKTFYLYTRWCAAFWST